jgi:hypothetical protein
VTILYHRTTVPAARRILVSGLEDGEGYYLTDELFRGVWLSEEPLDENEGAKGPVLLEVDIDLVDDALGEYEWLEDGKPYREFLIPAEVLRGHSWIQVLEFEDQVIGAPTTSGFGEKGDNLARDRAAAMLTKALAEQSGHKELDAVGRRRLISAANKARTISGGVQHRQPEFVGAFWDLEEAKRGGLP